MWAIRRFRPQLWPTLAVLALLPVLLGLGTWQLQRAQDKAALMALYQERSTAAPVPLAQALAGDAAPLPYTRVTATGRYLTDRQFLLDNRLHRGRVGFQVLTPLELTERNALVLVNRGWVPLQGSRANLPDPPAPTGTVTVEGLLRRPVKPPFIAAGGGDRGTWPRLVQAAVPSVTEAALDRPVVPYVILLSPQGAGGFVRDWTAVPAGFGPNRHYGYAFQWFALAATLVILYVVFSFKWRRD